MRNKPLNLTENEILWLQEAVVNVLVGVINSDDDSSRLTKTEANKLMEKIENL